MASTDSTAPQDARVAASLSTDPAYLAARAATDATFDTLRDALTAHGLSFTEASDVIHLAVDLAGALRREQDSIKAYALRNL